MIILWILLALIAVPFVIAIIARMWTWQNLWGLLGLIAMFYGIMWLKYGYA